MGTAVLGERPTSPLDGKRLIGRRQGMAPKTLQFTRPLAVFDLETTGLDTATARIVQLGVVRLDVDGQVEHSEEILIHPGLPIPPEVSRVHGITDAMVQDRPRFAALAPHIVEVFADCDLAGFNVERFDLPILVRELEEAGYPDFEADRKVIDVLTIYRKNERRDLAAAVRFYLNREHVGAHTALADAQATSDILLAQLARYDLPHDNAGLHDYCHEKNPRFVDQAGKFVWVGREVAINFGKHRGTLLRDMVMEQRGYLEWILGADDFSEEVVSIVRRALEGESL